MEQEVNNDQVDQSPESVAKVDEKKDFVAYESFRKSVDAEKKARAKANELEAQLNAIKERELESQGKTEELLKTYKQRVDELDGTLKSERKKYAWERITSGLKIEATKNNCIDPDAFIKLLDDSDFDALQVEDGYKLNQDSVKRLIEEKKKQNFYLFQGKPVVVNDRTPSAKVDKEVTKKPSEMGRDELNANLKKSLSSLIK